MPLVSVVMPVYNGEKYLKESIDSILNQTISDLELIIVDDGSTDRTSDIIKSYSDKRIVYIKNEVNLRISRSLNKALEASKGEFIARMDADDISLPKRLQKQIEYMNNHPEVEVCGSNVMVFGADDRSWPSSESHERLKVDSFFSCCLAHPTVMFRRSIVESGEARYNPEFDHMEDYELWTRLLKKHRFACIKEPLLKYRVHPSQTTKNNDENYTNQMSQIKKRLLDDLGVDFTEDELDAFCGKSDGVKKNKNLRSLLLKVLDANKKAMLYSPKYLFASVNNVIMGTFEAKGERRRFLMHNIKYYLSPSRVKLFLRFFI